MKSRSLNLSFSPEAVRQRQIASELAFVDGILAKIHTSLHQILRQKWQALRGNDAAGLRFANTWLRQQATKWKQTPFAPDLAADYDDLQKLAKARANEMTQYCGMQRNFGNSEEESSALLINYALEKYSATVKSKHIEGSALRLKNEKFWKRKLSSNQERALEHEHILNGIINKFSECYVSNEQVKRFQARNQRNEEMLQNAVVINDLGNEVTLADFVANNERKLAETMCRLIGLEGIGSSLGYVGLFITVTCPSKFHAQKLDKTGAYSFNNPNFDGSNPRDANDYLCAVWVLLRAAFSDYGIDLFGMRVAEPHGNACPHWHLLIFVPRKQRGLVVRLFRKYFRKMDKYEPMAWKHRFNVKDIDYHKGSAAGYLIKYLCKNMNGQGMFDSQGLIDKDFDSGLDVVSSATRVKAWASCWGIRQFQFIGSAPVGIWRELRRIDGLTNDEFSAAADAADRGDWAEFTHLMKLDRKVLLKRDAGLNRYREPVQKIKGLIDTNSGSTIITREREWELVFKGFDLPRNILNNCRLENQVDSLGQQSLSPLLHFDASEKKQPLLVPLQSCDSKSNRRNSSPPLRLGG
ncbi:replication endonuclease [Deefgea tanakiae]|uniref:Replication endonuclease n=1 Tax=Deefgea tanakiae TaxID=2865840 RepID=A0ABX8Z7F4_9NEIS|nr:replication endonuclease [Deefgea tanakiae]QZA78491.1 replication endonuclease [Deefgea tanakiae]